MITTALDYKTASMCARNQRFKWDLIYIFNSDPTSDQYRYLNEMRRIVNSVVCYYFDDIDCSLYPYIIVNEKDIKSIIKFAMNKNNVMIACANGITRSVSIAYVIRCIEEDPRIAIESMTKRKSHPNELIVRLGADLLQNEEVWAVYEEIYGRSDI